MKTKIIISALFLSTILFSCKKDDVQPNNGNGTTQPTTGSLYFKNNQSDPYTIYLDGNNIGILQPNTTSGAYTVTTNISHDVKAVQYSGYIFTPTEYTGTATVNPGGSVTWTF